MKLGNARFFTISALCGALGVLSGYAIYLTYRQVTLADPAEHAPARFAFSLLITAVIAYAIEWVREVIREGRIEQAAHPVFRTVGTFVIVLMFELFVTGFHTSSDLHLDSLRTAAAELLGTSVDDTSSTWTLVLAAGMWIVVGALLAAWLTLSVRESSERGSQRILRSAREGLAGGILFAPAVLALYVICGRCFFALIKVFYDYGGGSHSSYFLNPLPVLWHNIWLSQNRLIQDTVPRLTGFLVMLPFGLLVTAAERSVWIFFPLYLSMALFAGGYPWWRKTRPIHNTTWKVLLGLAWLGCLVYTAVPFAYALFLVLQQLAHTGPLLTLLKIAALAAFLWGVPGALLGGLTPMLRRVATHTRNWAFVGYGAAVLLVVATVIAHTWWPLVPALAAFAVGYLFHRGSSVYEYWPFAALCVAAGICGATSITQQLTFASEVAGLHSIDMLRPAPAATPAVAGRVLNYDTLTPTELARLQATSYTAIATIRDDNGNLAVVPIRIPDQQAVELVQKIFKDHAAEIQQINDSVTQPPPEPVMPSAKDLPPANSYIEDAIKRINQPDFGKTSAPSPSAKAPSVQPSPADQATPTATTEIAPAQIATAIQTPEGATTHGAETNSDSAEQAKRAAQALELSISGSVGFWVTVGLLACWSIQDTGQHSERSESSVEA